MHAGAGWGWWLSRTCRRWRGRQRRGPTGRAMPSRGHRSPCQPTSCSGCRDRCTGRHLGVEGQGGVAHTACEGLSNGAAWTVQVGGCGLEPGPSYRKCGTLHMFARCGSRKGQRACTTQRRGAHFPLLSTQGCPSTHLKGRRSCRSRGTPCCAQTPPQSGTTSCSTRHLPSGRIGCLNQRTARPHSGPCR